MIINDDPTATITIGFNAIDGIGHKVYYDVVDYGTDVTAYSQIETVYKSFDNFRGMNTKFVKLTNLSPNTTYYFVIADDNSVSRRFYFTTASDNPEEPLSVIMGGDSRNNRDIRRNANKLVAKIKPHVVTFAGDMTNLATSTEWQNWFDDWQETITPDGRMTPVIVAEGNHEKNVFSTVSYIERFFDAPILGYYAVEYNSLLKIFTLNTEVSITGNQTTWLASELSTSWDFTWKIAQYHKPMRPHYASKADGTLQYSNWADLFFNYGIRLVQESDMHLCKATWPIRPSTEDNSDEGFIEDLKGTVYTGSGCWGAPLREPDDLKDWTRDAGSVNHFQWAIISKEKIDVRTVLTDNADEVCHRDLSTPIETSPTNIKYWNPPNGELIRIPNENIIDCSSNFAASALEGTAPLTVDFDASNSFCMTSTAPSTYSWNFGDGNTKINTTSTSNTFTNPGVYTVTLQMENNGNKYFKTSTIIVNNPICSPENVVINEIQFNPDPFNDTGDYIELYNPNPYGIDLSCYVLSTSQSSYVLENVYIPAESYYIVVENPDNFKLIHPTVTDISEFSGIDILESGDQLTITDEVGCVTDFVDFDIVSPWPTDPNPYILQLIDPTLDNILPGSWEINTTNGTPGEANSIVTVTPTGNDLFLKAFLEGPFDIGSNLMLTALQSSNLLPQTQPYGSTNHNYNGTETATNFDLYVTDWILIELRDTLDPNIIIETRAALIRNDGIILDTDNQAGVEFTSPPGDYYVAIFHKSHLGVLSANKISLPNTESNSYDFTTDVSQAMGTQQLKQLPNGISVLHVGDFDANGLINNIDYNYWGSSSAVINQYVNWDSDLNALVNNLDYNNWDINKSKVGILEVQK